ncbi:helix-turn-helix domain-containing protein [Cellulomonas cellasea]|uniref:TetR/AcrR family transcriptional regulator n=1 Tax=Cellulomonas cellasea TaxID=43670 RepID=UPI0025A46E30|nr:TetR/AcrR family transcriptional regulator [Cellulomonas cellasea]MDM8084821.1 helix-turn-helix domain-containing protein [Cellulomonas cellasea]
MTTPGPSTREPLTREERQRQTRSALIAAARAVFARDGYHRARLEAIAQQAGYSKGAVYSNFDGKAALFLAVIDDDLARADRLGRETNSALPSDSAAAGFLACDDADASDSTPDEEAMLQVAHGFALASLEFIATAAREAELTPELETRMRHMLTLYTGATLTHSPAGEDPLSVSDRTMLLAALEQGSALLSLSGIAPLPDSLVREGMLRVLTPRAATPGAEAPTD